MLELGPTTFIQIINFVLLMFILRALLWKPLMEALDSRQKRIEAQMKEAEGINQEARDLKTKYEAQMADARSEAAKVMRNAQLSAEQTKEQIVSEAREEASRILRAAERETRTEKDKAMGEVKRYLADLTVSTASKVLQDSLDKPTQEKILADVARRVKVQLN